MATDLIGQGTWSHARSVHSKHCRPPHKISRAVVGEYRVASGLLQRADPATIKAPAPLRLTMLPTAQDAAPPLQINADFEQRAVMRLSDCTVGPERRISIGQQRLEYLHVGRRFDRQPEFAEPHVEAPADLVPIRAGLPELERLGRFVRMRPRRCRSGGSVCRQTRTQHHPAPPRA